MTEPVANATDNRAIESGIYVDGEMDSEDLRSMLYRITDGSPVYVDGRRCVFAYAYNGRVYLESSREGLLETPTGADEQCQ